MNSRSAVINAGAACFLFVCIPNAWGTTTTLLRAPATSNSEAGSVLTYAGKIDVSVSKVKPAQAITAVVLADSLTAAQLESVKKDLLSAYALLRGRPLRVAAIRNGAFGIAGPFASRAQLKSALSELGDANPDTSSSASSAGSSSAVPASAVLDNLCASASQLGEGWSRVLIIGELPPLEKQTNEYASALLLRAFGKAALQVSWYPFSGANESWLGLFRATGGGVVDGPLSDFFRSQSDAGQLYFQVVWTPPTPAAGFVVSKSAITDLQGQLVLEAPDLAAPEGATLPSVAEFAKMRTSVNEATELLTEDPLSAASEQKIRDDLKAALEMNARDPGALLTAAAFHEKVNDYDAATRERAALTEVRPSDPAAFAALGHALVLAKNFDGAEAPLKRAMALRERTPEVAEDLARIRLAQKDDRAALPYLEEALSADSKRQDLWFIQADAAERVKDTPLAAHSLEQGLALGGVHPREGAFLARLYIAANQKAKASQLAREILVGIPPDADVRAEFAASLDELQLTSEALSAWRRVLEVQGSSGRAHVRTAQLLLGSGDVIGAARAADVGLAVAPKYAPLYIAKADALEKSGQLYEARRALEEGAANVPDAALLARLASTEDSYGGLAASAYQRFVESLEATSPERPRAVERGLAVSVRDGDAKHMQFFGSVMQPAGATRSAGPAVSEQAGGWAVIPGGLDALAFSAHGRERIPPEKFLVEYCRTLIERIPEQPTPASKEYVREIEEHFARIEALEALGKRNGDRVVITLSANGKEEQRRTEKALELLGVKLRTSKGKVELEREEKKGQAKKQETLEALAIDEVGLQEALAQGKTYAVEIVDERVPVYPGEKVWREAFYAKESEPGGIATALLRVPRMARLYVGLSYLDRAGVSALLSAVSLASLKEEHYADLLYDYAAALAVQNGHAVVPGGSRAEAIWANLAGAHPAQPGTFFRALLELNNGRLLAFFFAVSQLDRAHQEFFTANPSRTIRFYKFFAESEEEKRAASAARSDSAFVQFLRSVPLDSQGHVDFPGSAQVWTVAKGRWPDDQKMTKMMKGVSKTAAPEVEDELLLNLAQKHYKENAARHSELENLLAVARIDMHRARPLDEPSAVLLAQNYADFSTTYAYFAEITELSYAEYAQFFAAVDRAKTRPALEANLVLGQLHSLIEWICLLRRREAIDDEGAAKLFKYVCDRFSAADGPASYAGASLESVRTILGFCKTAEKKGSTDEQIQGCLVGSHEKHGNGRSKDFARVLELQKVPSLDDLYVVYDGLARVKAQGGGDPEPIRKSVERLPTVELPKGTKAVSKEKGEIVGYEIGGAQKAAAELAQKLSKRKANSKDIEKASQELLAELQPQVTLALAGRVYAYFLRASDLVVSEDPLLLRKHRYFDFDSETGRKDFLPQSSFEAKSEGTGSYFLGGFAKFPLAAGHAAAIGWKGGGAGGSEFAAAQIAAIRSASWDRLDESDQRLASLRITVAREWICMSAKDAEALRILSEETMGLLSLSRRADLLNGVQAGNWRGVWESVTLPDLFVLGGKYLERFKSDLWTSPVTVALRSVAAGNNGARLNALGTIPYHSFGCSHAHIVPDAPYEEYELHMFPDELAERSAQFKLFLTFQADSLGVEPSALSDIAEALAEKAFGSAQALDAKDWRAMLAAFESVTAKDIRQELER